MLSKIKEIKSKKQRLSRINKETQLSKARKSTKSNIIRNKSISKQKVCGQTCKKHQFEIKPIGYSLFLSKGVTEPITVNFCSKGNSTTIPIPIIPLRLKNQPQVPLFILDNQIRRYEHYISSHREQFQDAINKANNMVSSDKEQDEQVIKVIPKTKNCQICRMKIDTQQEYQKHINSLDHKVAIKKSVGQKYIMEQTEAFQTQKIEEMQQNKIINQLMEVSNIMKETKQVLKGLFRKR